MFYLGIAVLFSALTGCFPSQLKLNQGIRSFQVQDFRQAFVRLRPEAEKGNPEAQYAIGYMYYYGQGVIEDRRKAWNWITLSAKQGNPDAQAAMAILQKSAGRTDERIKSQD